MPTALITGIAGQDGRYLADLLVQKGYELFGLVRPHRLDDRDLDDLREIATLIPGDVRSARSVEVAMEISQPHEVYNLAGVSSIDESMRDPKSTFEVNALGPLHIANVMKRAPGETRLCQASSSEIFGVPDGRPRNEDAPIRPANPYAAAKAHAHTSLQTARESDGIFAASAILFNHESPRRDLRFVSRRISMGVARISAGLQSELHLQNLRPRRDWGFAGDHVRALWLIVQQERPDDFVIATGTTHSVGDFVAQAFMAAGIRDWKRLVHADEDRPRPSSPGDAMKARATLGWTPEVTFEELVSLMVQHDHDQLDRSGKPRNPAS